MRASLWQSGAGLMDRQEKRGRKVHQEENSPSKQEVVAFYCKYFVTHLILKENYDRRRLKRGGVKHYTSLYKPQLLHESSPGVAKLTSTV